MCLTTPLNRSFTEAFKLSERYAASMDVLACETTGMNATPGTGMAATLLGASETPSPAPISIAIVVH